jgi:hypothetical protein
VHWELREKLNIIHNVLSEAFRQHIHNARKAVTKKVYLKVRLAVAQTKVKDLKCKLVCNRFRLDVRAAGELRLEEALEQEKVKTVSALWASTTSKKSIRSSRSASTRVLWLVSTIACAGNHRASTVTRSDTTMLSASG